MKNIDATETREWNSGLGWDPIGNSENPFDTPFTGTFDGQGKTISNLYSANSDDFVGLFSYTENATISNLKLLNIQMGGTNWIGGLVGAGAFTTIDEVEVSGLVGGSVDVGGIAGNLAGSTISNSYNHATVGGGADTPAGGIVGNFSGNIINSYNTGTIHGYTNVGGIAGEFAGEIINSYNTGTIIGDSSKIGGIVGYTLHQSNITNSYSTGNVTGDSYVGGLIGDGSWSTISNSYSNSPVQGNTSVGGLIGLANYAVITNTYSTGSVTGTENIGGLIGERDLTEIYNSFSVGEISGETTLGGLIGKGIYGTLENVYWHNSNNNCCGNGDCDNCLKETNNSNFFLHNGSTHAVYYNSPIWTDGNWIWSESNYPKLYWE